MAHQKHPSQSKPWDVTDIYLNSMWIRQFHPINLLNDKVSMLGERLMHSIHLPSRTHTPLLLIIFAIAVNSNGTHLRRKPPGALYHHISRPKLHWIHSLFSPEKITQASTIALMHPLTHMDSFIDSRLARFTALHGIRDARSGRRSYWRHCTRFSRLCGARILPIILYCN